jgi:hypothetical protein
MTTGAAVRAYRLGRQGLRDVATIFQRLEGELIAVLTVQRWDTTGLTH